MAARCEDSFINDDNQGDVSNNADHDDVTNDGDGDKSAYDKLKRKCGDNDEFTQRRLTGGWIAEETIRLQKTMMTMMMTTTMRTTINKLKQCMGVRGRRNMMVAMDDGRRQKCRLQRRNSARGIEEG
jgi:hypothetical protein